MYLLIRIMTLNHHLVVTYTEVYGILVRKRPRRLGNSHFSFALSQAGCGRDGPIWYDSEEVHNRGRCQ